MGKAPIHNEPTTARLTIADAAGAFLAECHDREAKGKLAHSTVQTYTSTVSTFCDQVGVKYMDEITREVLLGHETWLYQHIEKKAFGKKETTVANRFRCLNIFLTRNGIKMVKSYQQIPNDPGLLEWKEAPRVRKGNGNAAPDAYSLDEINQMLEAATEDEKDLIQFFLKLGVREGEAQHAEWSDIESRLENGQTVHEFHVREKMQYEWRPKDKEDRRIPIEDGLYQRLLERRKRVHSNLIFPNRLGTPDSHLIFRLQRASKKAGLTKRATLHKFRRTFASLMISHSDLQTVQELLGHSDISTTSLYLAPNQEKARRATKTAFNGVGN
jgi:integrase/recombinase XerD